MAQNMSPRPSNLAGYEVVYLVGRVLVHLRVLTVFQVLAAAYPIYLASMYVKSKLNKGWP